MRRGEIWVAATGQGLGSKPRPVLIVTSDAFVERSIILVVPFTSTQDGEQIARPIVEPNDINGLTELSKVMIDRIMPVRREKFGSRIGRLVDADLQRVERAILIYLGFAG